MSNLKNKNINTDLAGLLVISIEQAVAGPYASGRLADAGARVIKIERPEGDFARKYDAAGGNKSSYFIWLNRGKESICLDLKNIEDKKILINMVKEADVLIQNLMPGAVDRMVGDFDQMQKLNPSLIRCDISGYGSTGDFSNVKARDCMIPRTEIIAVDIDDSLETVMQLFIAKGLSKVIIYRDSIDNIIGYVHSYDLFKSPQSIKQILLPIHFVPSVTTGEELLSKFTEQSGNIAIVSDEYGGTAGMVTLEDVIEEIFGEIEDEHDKDNLVEERLSETHFRFSARVEIDYLNEQYQLNIPESEDYETLGGLILFELANIPEKNSKLKMDGFSFVVEEVTDRRIEIVSVYLKS